MPTNVTSRPLGGTKLGRWSALIEALQADEITVLLIWTATGLGLTLLLAAFGQQPDSAQALLMLG